MDLVKIELNLYSEIANSFYTIENEAILYAKFSGVYRYGSEGNADGLYLFSKIVSYYFLFEPIAVIIDLQELQYEWGNTILKTLNLFSEIGRDEYEKRKHTFIITSDKNDIAINSLLKKLDNKHIQVCKKYETALISAKRQVLLYLEPD